MAEIHMGTTLIPSKLELLTDWMGDQRWYAAKGSTPRLTRLAAWRLDDPAGQVGIETILVRDDGGPEPVTYQVPLTYRAAAVEELAHALVGTMEHGILGRRWVYDAPHDPIYAERLLAMIRGEARAESSTASGEFDDRFTGVGATGRVRTVELPGSDPGGRVRTVELRGSDPGAAPRFSGFRGSRVLSGEQSNTSIIIDTVDEENSPRPVIVKVFRTLADGDNPDVVLQSALRAAGNERVPAVIGAVRGTWPTSATDSEDPSKADSATGHLGFAQEFIPDTEDAWRVALRAAMTGADFTDAAGDLGEATAAVHTALAASLPSTEATTEDIARITAVMRRRLAAASDLVPEIAARAAQVEALFAAAERTVWPPLQRIHGDYHLGQVLHSPERGWLLLDFEGEPLRPLAERSLPDSHFRDLAGMLRSFDYAGGSAEQDDPDRSAREWMDNAVTAFLDGYSRAAADPRDHPALLRAFLLDKALYEIVYEARNRPTWLAIPVTAITRLLDQPGDDSEQRGVSS